MSNFNYPTVWNNFVLGAIIFARGDSQASSICYTFSFSDFVAASFCLSFRVKAYTVSQAVVHLSTKCFLLGFSVTSNDS